MVSKYPFLSGRLRQLGLRQGDVARELDLSDVAISHRLLGKTPWKIGEMYKVLEICRAQPDELHVYFPPPPRAAKQKRRGAA